MPKEVRLPQLGQTMEEATIVNCLVDIGNEVKKGDVIFEIETDKATLEVESPYDGFVKYILARLDQTLPVGEPVLVLGQKDEELQQSFIDSLKSSAVTRAAPAVQIHTSEPAKIQAQSKAKADRVIASPRQYHGRGSPRTKKEAKLGQTIPLTKMQKLTAERMLRSKRQIPCFYLTVKADVTDLVELRTEMNQTGDTNPAPPRGGVKLSYNDFIIRAVAIGLEQFPVMTGQLVGDAIELAKVINIGLAISAPDGLIVPVIKDVSKKDVTAIARETGALIEKTGSNKLLLTDLEGGCITISNLGAFGVESFIPIVVPGQCSILGIGQITDTCVPNNDDIIVRKLMSITLSVDHRVANGAYAARFLDFVKKLLEDTSAFI